MDHRFSFTWFGMSGQNPRRCIEYNPSRPHPQLANQLSDGTRQSSIWMNSAGRRRHRSHFTTKKPPGSECWLRDNRLSRLADASHPEPEGSVRRFFHLPVFRPGSTAWVCPLNLRDPAPKSKRNLRLPACLAVEAGSVSAESTQLAPNMSICSRSSLTHPGENHIRSRSSAPW